jgi:phytoene dehydrogenase-like protein
MDLGFSRHVRDDLTFIFDIERDLYFSLHSEVTPDLAPVGGQLLHAMAYLSPEEAADELLRAERKADLIDGLNRHFPGWRDALVVERVIPNVLVTAARQTPAQQGSGRVPLRSGVAANLYFAGDARDLPYNLTEICLASAMEVADAILGEVPAGVSAPAPQPESLFV